MATVQRRIPTDLRKHLIDEAGGKCANPGCSNWKVHIHHIKQWSIYKSHEQAHMIAICPSCHNEVHHGSLKITDEQVYEWKGIKRPVRPSSALIYAEAADQLKLILGGFAAIATPHDEAIIFQLTNTSELRLVVLDGRWVQVTTRIVTTGNEEVLRVVQNHIRVINDLDVKFEHRAGRVLVTVPNTAEYMPRDAIAMMQRKFPDFGKGDRLTALDVEVLKPGVIRVEGFWVGHDMVAITSEAFCMCRPGNDDPICLFGAGEDTVINWTGPVTSAMFNLK